MDIGIHLLIHNILTIVSGVVALVLAVFVLVNNPRKKINIVIALINIFVLIFMTSHLIGTNLSDAHASKIAFMFNICTMFITIFSLHATLIVIKKERERMKLLVFIYIVGVALTIFYVMFPDTFMLDSIPKMYFPNYYNPGPLQWALRYIFDFVVVAYLLYELVVAMVRSNDPVETNRIKLWTATLVVGNVIGSIPLLLEYNIQIDPAYGIWSVPLYTIPLMYAIMNYELVDIRIVAKKAFVYGLLIATIGAFISLINSASQYIEKSYPTFPFWVIPLFSALIAVGIGVFVWKNLREGDLLKYEFITIATHKFRTPLTHIKWATENLSKVPMQAEGKTQLEYITSANGKLIELTNVLMNVSESENDDYSYHYAKSDISLLAKETIAQLTSQFNAKKIRVEKLFESDVFVSVDASRVKFVMQVFIENAIQYTSSGGLVTVKAEKSDRSAIFSVHDTGIGMTHEEISLLFTKFYRSNEAKLTDTEGMGIGLYISKDTILRHGGKIWAESEGLNRGSTFYFSLPVMK